MCIIVVKEKGFAFPTEEILKSCFESNPDGAGFMVATGKEVVIRKGFMDFKSFINALNKARKEFGDNKTYVMHFRITTQAGVRPDCTHPYPISENMDDLRKLTFKCKVGIAHNGIISLTSQSHCDYGKRTKGAITYNDTMLFVTEYLSNMKKLKQSIIETLAPGNRFAVLYKDGTCNVMGHGWINDNGIQYSNNTYLPYVPTGYSFWGSDERDYDNDYDEWDQFYNERTGTFDFDEEYCPMSEEETDMYCKECSNYAQCKSFKHYLESIFKQEVYFCEECREYVPEIVWDEKTKYCVDCASYIKKHSYQN